MKVRVRAGVVVSFGLVVAKTWVQFPRPDLVTTSEREELQVKQGIEPSQSQSGKRTDVSDRNVCVRFTFPRPELLRGTNVTSEASDRELHPKRNAQRPVRGRLKGVLEDERRSREQGASISFFGSHSRARILLRRANARSYKSNRELKPRSQRLTAKDATNQIRR